MTTSLLQAPTLVLASIPSPSQAVWHLGPFPVRAYALCISAGAVPFGLLGGLGICGGVDQ